MRNALREDHELFGTQVHRFVEREIARAFVDGRVQRICGGTSEIMKEIISRGL